MTTIRLHAREVTSDADVELMRQVRNDCYEFMTRHRQYITTDEQSQWWASLDKDALRCFLFLLEGEPVGYGTILLAGDKSWVTGGLTSDSRNKGLGQELFSYLIERCATEVWLEVRSHNIRAKKLYLKLGFEPVGVPADGVQTMRLA